MFEELEKIHKRPAPFEGYSACELWTDDYTSRKMLSFHLNDSVDISSRNHAFIVRSVDWIISRFQVGKGTKIMDFGCGPGLYTTKLAQKEAQVTGIDFSRRSIEYAKEVSIQKRLSINYVHQNYLDFMTDERFDLILMIMCDFCALSPLQRKTMLKKYHSILEPDGAILLDVYSLPAFEKRQEVTKYEVNLLDGFWSPNKYYGFLNTFKYEPEKVVLDQYVIIEQTRIRTVNNWLQYFSPESLAGEFADCGFRIENLYGDVAGWPYLTESNEFAVVAKKKES